MKEQGKFQSIGKTRTAVMEKRLRMRRLLLILKFRELSVASCLHLWKKEVLTVLVVICQESSQRGGHPFPVSVLPQYNTYWYVPVCPLEVNISL